MRVGCQRPGEIGSKISIKLPLPPKIDPTVTMMTVEDKPDVTYNDLGGCKEQIDKIREVVEGTYDLGDVYNRIDSFKSMQEIDLDKAIQFEKEEAKNG